MDGKGHMHYDRATCPSENQIFGFLRFLSLKTIKFHYSHSIACFMVLDGHDFIIFYVIGSEVNKPFNFFLSKRRM